MEIDAKFCHQIKDSKMTTITTAMAMIMVLNQSKSPTNLTQSLELGLEVAVGLTT